jgi:hypothetical protein
LHPNIALQSDALYQGDFVTPILPNAFPVYQVCTSYSLRLMARLCTVTHFNFTQVPDV